MAKCKVVINNLRNSMRYALEMDMIEFGHSFVRSLFCSRRSLTRPRHTAHFTQPMLRSIACSLVRFRAHGTVELFISYVQFSRYSES